MPAGQLIDALQRTIQQTDPVDRRECQFLFRARPRQQRGQRPVVTQPSGQHIGQHGKASDQVMLLEHHAGLQAMAAHGTRGGNVTHGGGDDTAGAGTHQPVQ